MSAANGPCHNVNVLTFTRMRRDETPAAWFDDVMQRVTTFSTRVLAVTDPTAFVDQLWGLWAQRSPLLGVWAVTENGTVYGHLVATVQLWNGETVGWVHQAECDVPISVKGWDQMHAELNAWLIEAGTSLGKPITRCTMMTRRPKGFERMGWREEATMLSRRVV